MKCDKILHNYYSYILIKAVIFNEGVQANTPKPLRNHCSMNTLRYYREITRVEENLHTFWKL